MTHPSTPGPKPQLPRLPLLPLLLTRTLPLVSCITLGGCAATTTPAWDARFGDTVRMLQAGQLIAPEAPTRHGQTVPPVDGRSVSEAMHHLHQSYRSPPPSQVLPMGAGESTNLR